MTKKIEYSETSAKKIPVLTAIFGGYNLVINKFKEFIILGTIFSVVLMALYFCSGQDALCYNRYYRASHFCNNNIVSYIVIHTIAAFVICIFLRCWYQIGILGKPLSWMLIIKPQTSELKIAGGFLLYFCTLLLAGLSFYLLLIRDPNPDWKIELLYFTVVSLGFFVPILALRFSVYFAFFADNSKLPSLSCVWNKTAGNGFALLSGIIILMIIGLSISQAMMSSFARISEDVSIYTALGSEYLSNVSILFIITCFMNYCYLQRNFLFERIENEHTTN